MQAKHKPEDNKRARKEVAPEYLINIKYQLLLIHTIKELQRKNVNFAIKQLAQASGISHLASRKEHFMLFE